MDIFGRSALFCLPQAPYRWTLCQPGPGDITSLPLTGWRWGLWKKKKRFFSRKNSGYEGNSLSSAEAIGSGFLIQVPCDLALEDQGASALGVRKGVWSKANSICKSSEMCEIAQQFPWLIRCQVVLLEVAGDEAEPNHSTTLWEIVLPIIICVLGSEKKEADLFSHKHYFPVSVV